MIPSIPRRTRGEESKASFGDHGVALHSDQMREAAGSEEGWKATVIAGKAVALSAYELLNHPEKVKAIQEEFKKIKGGEKK